MALTEMGTVTVTARTQQAKLNIVVIDDDPDVLNLVSTFLGDEPDVELMLRTDPVAGLELIRRTRPQLVLVDLMMPGVSGMEVLERVVRFDPLIDVVLMTAYYSTESAVEAIKKGAGDYLNKPFQRSELLRRLEPFRAEARRREHSQELTAELIRSSSFKGIIGRSPSMQSVFARIRRAAPYFRTILITGATGTGKELAARAVHSLSPVGTKGPFVVCNCAAIPEQLVESELFGNVRGAFTGAVSDRKGLFEAADGGTLFLDEIGELPLAAQAKFLRAVENQEFQRVGSPAARKVDVRIVCATNRDLQHEIEQKKFRPDLFFRISMLDIELPPLRRRHEDVPLLIQYFVGRFAAQYGKRIDGVTGAAEEALLARDWVGNVRELENAIGYACIMADAARIDVCDLPARANSVNPVAEETVELISVAEMERKHARRVLQSVGGDRTRAAEVLEVSRATLYRLVPGNAPEAT